jgi:two-component system nitrogen regulation response regulator NtrX
MLRRQGRHTLNLTPDLHLLYVEDNNDLREVVSAALADQGYDVAVAECAGDGLALLREQHFNLVISDYALPDHTGTWMLREAAASGLLDRTEALIVTASPDPEDAGDIPVLQKPLDLDRLLCHVERLLALEPPPSSVPAPVVSVA